MKESPKEIMTRFKFIPKQEDVEAAFFSAQAFSHWKKYHRVDNIEAFHCGFNRGMFWAQEKYRELLEILGTDDLKVAKKRVRQLMEQSKQRDH